MDHNEYTEFVPFNAINEFMRDDFRLEVIRLTLSKLSGLPEENQKSINILTRKLVQVSGFRNSIKAPISLRVKASVDAFQKSPEFVAAILSGWAEFNADLRDPVYELLVEREWEILPVDADRTKLPGFFITWPEGENFETLFNVFNEIHPGLSINSDDLSLMVVWLSMCLPYSSDQVSP